MRLSLIFSRYLVKNYLRWFLTVLLIVTTIILLFDFSEIVRKASSRHDVNLILILRMSVLKLPTLLETVSPFVALFAGILCFWQMNRYHELEVARASGISIWQILLPLTFGALLIGFFDLVFVNPIGSKMMLHYEHLENYYLNYHKDSLSITESGIWIREVEGDRQAVLQVHHIEVSPKKLSQIVIFESDLNDKFLRRIDAAKGHFQDHSLHLENVWVTEPDRVPVYSDTLTMNTTLTFRDLLDTGANPASISFWDLMDYASLLEKSGIASTKYTLQWHTMLARWAWLAVMVVLAATCTLRPLRQGGFAWVLALGVGTVFLLYFFKDIVHALGNSGTIPVILAAWIPTGVSALLGVSLLLHLEDG